MKKKLISSLLTAICIITTIPVGASATWKNDNTGWWYEDGSSYSTGWKQIDEFWYYFDSDGYMKTGWLQDNGKWYYLVSSGVMKTGWVQDGSSWYYLDENGAMATGKISISNKIYEFGNDGGWIDVPVSNNNSQSQSTNTNTKATESKKPSIDKIKSAVDNSWVQENGNYYFKLTGADYAKGEWNVDDSLYYFDENGVMQTGEVTMDDGVKYLFGDDGKFVKSINRDNWRLYASDGATTGNALKNYPTMEPVSKDSKVVFNLENTPLGIGKIYSSDSNKTKTTVVGTGHQAKTVYVDAQMDGTTLTCRTNQTIQLYPLEVGNEDNWGKTPKLLISTKSSNKDVAFLGFDIGYADGYMRMLFPYVITNKSGTTTVTMDVNGATVSFDVVVTE